MKEQEIIEGNKLICEFIGFVRFFPNMTSESDLSNFYYYPYIDNVFDERLYTSTIKMTSDGGRYCNQSIRDSHHLKDMQFHKSYGWLMPVVEKIESLKHPVYIYSNNCIIYERVGKDHGWMVECIYPTKIEAIYNACIKFIKCYNQNK